jgi:hypothetical protein
LTGRLTAALVLALTVAAPLAAQTMRNYTARRPLAGAQPPLRTTLDFGAGRVVVRAGAADELYRVGLRYDGDRYTPIHRYDPRTGILHLGVRSVGGAGLRVTSRSQLEQVARFEFAPSVPLLLAANLGASEAVLDLGGLNLVELAVRSGATRGTVDVSRPTTGDCREALFSVGAAELVALRLANAGCAEVRVEGGVGRAVLDFTGAWRRDILVSAELSMGTLTLRVPRGTGVLVTAERFLTRFAVEGLERRDDTWTTPSFATADRKLTVELKTNVAGFEVEWVDGR